MIHTLLAILAAVLATPQEDTLQQLERAVEVARGAEDRRLLADALARLADSHQQAGRMAQSQTLREEEIAIAGELGDTRREATSRLYLGAGLRTAGRLGEARNQLERVLELLQGLDDPALELQTTVQLGGVYEGLRDHETALAYLNEAIERCREMEQPLQLANALTSVARIQRERDELHQAQTSLEEALALADGIGHQPSQCWILGNLGDLHLALGNLARARECCERRLELDALAPNPYNEGWARWGLARVLVTTGNTAPAIEHAERSLELARQVGDRHLEASALLELGRVDSVKGHEDAARRRIGQALAINLESGELLGQANCHLALGQMARGEATGPHLERARVCFERAGSRIGLLWTLELEAEYFRHADPMRSRDLIIEQLSSAQERRNPAMEAQAYLTLGDFEEDLGDLARALEAYKKANDAAREAGNLWVELRATIGLSNVWRVLGDTPRALALTERAVALAHATEQTVSLIRALNQQGLLLGRLGDYAAAERVLEQALELAKADDRALLQTRVYCSLGLLELKRGNTSRALECYERGIRFAEEAGDPRSRTWCIAQQSSAYLNTGQFDQAREHAVRALDLGASTYGRLHTPHMVLASIALREGDLEQAESHIEQGRELLRKYGVRRLNRSTAADHRSQYARWGAIGQDLTAARLTRSPEEGLRGIIVEGLVELGHWKSRALLEGIVEHRIGGRTEEVLELRREQRAAQMLRDEILDEVSAAIAAGAGAEEVDRMRVEAREAGDRADTYEREIARLSPRDAALENAPDTDLTAALALLPADTTLVEYAEGQERLYAYVLSANELKHVELGVLTDVEATCARLLSGIANPASLADVGEVAVAGRAAYAALLGPLFESTGLPRNLVVIPSSVVSAIPLEALVVDAPSKPKSFEEVRFLLDETSVTYGPGLSVLTELAKRGPRKASGRVLILADPVYPTEIPAIAQEMPSSGLDALLGGSQRAVPHTEDLTRLAETRTEALGIARLLSRLSNGDSGAELLALEDDRSGSLRAQLFDLHLGNAARPNILWSGLREYSVLHLAAHGYVDNENVRRSGLAFSFTDEAPGWFTIEDVLDLDLDANLVVLSACETARGKVLAGEGVQSLARTFLYAGARGVVASLWAVADRETSQTMRHFYQEMLEQGHAAPGALTRAKRATRQQQRARGIRPAGAVGGAVTSGHPYYWAPFVHIGLPRPIPK